MRRLILNTAADLYTIWNWIVTGRWEPDMSDTADEQPRIITLTTSDGETIDCLIEQTDPLEWQATPVRDIHPGQKLTVNIDILPAGGRVNIVFPEDLVGRWHP